MPRIIIVGDVHGMQEELSLLLEKVGLTSEDFLIFAGDLLDKGPDSVAVVRFVRELSSTHNVVVVEGNHEEKHSRFRENILKRPEVAREMLINQPEMESITESLSQEDKDFLVEAVPFHKIEEHGILVIHAGIPANMDWFPPTVEEARSLGGKKKRTMAQTLRVREVSRDTGEFLAIGKAGEDDPFWAEVYDGRFGHVVFGHSPFRQVREFRHATGIDTGAVFGGYLTAMVIEDDGSRTFTSVKGRKFSEPLFWY